MLRFYMKLAPLAILALGCGGAPPPTSARDVPSASSPVEPTASTVRVWMDVEPAHLNPLVTPDEWCFRIALGPIYQPLFAVDAAGEPVAGGLASAVRLSADRLTIDVTLRDGASWHDGRPVSSSDVAFTYEAILDPRNGLDSLRRDLGDLHMVELQANRPREVRVRLHRPNAFLASVLSEIPVLPRHVFFSDKGKIDWLRNPASRRPIGSGPYRLREWKRGSRIVLRLTDEAARRPGAIQEIAYLAQPDGAAALGQLRRDELDVLSRILPVHYPDEALTPLVKKRFQEVRLRPARYAVVLLNVRRGPLGDARARQALAAAIDRDGLLADMRKGLGRRISVPGLDGALAPRGYDAAAAGRLLDEAGLRRAKPDGPRMSGGRPSRLEFLSVARAPMAEEQTRRIAADLGKVGLTVVTRFIEPADLFGRLRKGDFDAATLTFAMRPHGDLGPLIGTDGAFNHGGFSDAGLDAALEEVRRLGPGPERSGAWLRLGKLAEDRQPVIFLYAAEEVALVRRTLLNVTPTGDWLDLLHAQMAPASGGAPGASGGAGADEKPLR